MNPTIEALLPLYSTTDADQPDAIFHTAPNPKKVISALQNMLNVLLPGHSHESTLNVDHLPSFLSAKLQQFELDILPEIARALPFRDTDKLPEGTNFDAVARDLGDEFKLKLTKIRKLLITDIRAAFNGDPAAICFAEVKLTYPSILAIATHRTAHELYHLNIPILPRIMSEHIHSLTGIDIHPGATISQGFFIDHGTGVVIGETATIGTGVKIYQGVTLGAKSFPLDESGNPIKHIQRHPTVEDRVIIYANATILGGDTVIGSNSTIGGNVFLMESVPPNTVITKRNEALLISPKKNCTKCPKACPTCLGDE